MGDDERTRPTPPSREVCVNAVAALTRVAQVLGAVIGEVSDIASRVDIVETTLKRGLTTANQFRAASAESRAGRSVDDALAPRPRMTRAALDKAIDELLALLDSMGAPVEIPPRGMV